MQCAEIDYYTDSVNMLDIVLLFKLQSLAFGDDVIHHSRRRYISERKRLRVKYYMKGIPVCRSTFMFCHGITHIRLDRLLQIIKTEGAGQKLHGNYRRLPRQSTDFPSAENVVTFLQNYAETHSLFMPGHIAQKFAIVKLLPTGTTKKSVYAEYQAACEANGSPGAVSLQVFRDIWRVSCSDIAILPPRTDLCSFCQSIFGVKSDYIKRTDEEKSIIVGYELFCYTNFDRMMFPL